MLKQDSILEVFCLVGGFVPVFCHLCGEDFSSFFWSSHIYILIYGRIQMSRASVSRCVNENRRGSAAAFC